MPLFDPYGASGGEAVEPLRLRQSDETGPSDSNGNLGLPGHVPPNGPPPPPGTDSRTCGSSRR
jgi:hypothetical protein